MTGITIDGVDLELVGLVALYAGPVMWPILARTNRRFREAIGRRQEWSATWPLLHLRMQMDTATPTDAPRWVCKQEEPFPTAKQLSGAVPITYRHGKPYGAKTPIERFAMALVRAGHLALLEWLPYGNKTAEQWMYDACRYAAYYGHLNIVEWLASGITPRMDVAVAAARGGHLHILEWWHDRYRDTADEVNPLWEPSVARGAARVGRIDMLEWLCARGCPLYEGVCDAAARGGHLDTLQWLHEHGCPRNDEICIAAAKGGNVAVLEWIHNNGFPFDGTLLRVGACVFAATKGHLAAVQWLHAHRDILHGDTFRRAVASKNRDLIEWLFAQNCPWGSAVTGEAALTLDWDTLRWLHARGCPMDTVSYVTALSAQRRDIVQWLRDNGCPMTSMACVGASRIGDRETLLWLREQGCAWDAMTCAGAATAGLWDTVRWLRERDCPWDEWTTSAAAEQGDMDALAWARDQGCPWDARASRMAAYNGNEVLLQWMLEKGCPVEANAVDFAFAGNHMDVIKLLHVLRPTLFEHCWHAWCIAAKNNLLGIFEWGVENGIDCIPRASRDAAAQAGHHALVAWIDRHAPPSAVPILQPCTTIPWPLSDPSSP